MNPVSRLLPSRLLAAQLLGAPSPNTGPQPKMPAYALGSPGRPSPKPTLLINTFDNSGSVMWSNGHDPLSNRFAEVSRAFAIVAKKGSKRELGAILHFGEVPSSGEIGPVPITKAGLPQLSTGLRVPVDSTGKSVLGGALHRAYQLATEYPDHAATLVVLSDFELFDDDLAATLTVLVSFPGTVHAVVLGGGPAADQLVDRGVVVTKIKRDDPPGAVAKALFASLTRHRPGSRAYREYRASQAAPASTTPRSSRIPQQLIPGRLSRRKHP